MFSGCCRLHLPLVTCCASFRCQHSRGKCQDHALPHPKSNPHPPPASIHTDVDMHSCSLPFQGAQTALALRITSFDNSDMWPFCLSTCGADVLLFGLGPEGSSAAWAHHII